MLYLSRDFHNDHFGVVDTDDDTETVVSWNELSNAVIEDNIEIHGVKTNRVNKLDGSGSFTMIDTIYPYQDMRYYSKEQAKLKTLLGVDIRTWKGEVTLITIDSAVMPNMTQVRLSDYGKQVSGLIDVMWKPTGSGKSIILVLDNNIKIYGKPPVVGLRGVIWDISAITDFSVVRQMYKAFEEQGVSKTYWGRYVLDKKHRYK